MPRNAAKSLHILWVGKERRCQREEERERTREREGPLIALNEFTLQCLCLIFSLFSLSPPICVSVCV